MKNHIQICIGLPSYVNWERIRLQCRRLRVDSWVGKIPWRRERKVYPLQYSCLENVHGVTKSWTRLSKFHFTFLSYVHFVMHMGKSVGMGDDAQQLGIC